MFNSLSNFSGSVLGDDGRFMDRHDNLMKSNIKHSVNASICFLLIGIVTFIAGVFWTDYAFRDIQTLEYPSGGLYPAFGVFAYIIFPMGVGIVLTALGVRGIRKFS